MNRTIPLFIAAATILSAEFACAAPRTFVASSGNDANACSLGAPCRAFARALTQTDAGGEIIVLDSAGYGPVSIDKAVSIIAPAGVYAGVTAPSGDGIVVNAPGANVVLRGLDINGTGTSPGNGILYQDGASLLIDRCVVSGFANDGLLNGPTGIRLLAGGATVANSVVKNNGRGGISVEGTVSTRVAATIASTRVENNGSGIGAGRDAGVSALAAANVSVRDSVAIGNFRGFSACKGDGSLPNGVLSVDHSLSDRNVVGVFVSANQFLCAVRVSNSTITDNSLFGIEQQSGAVVTSLGNNFVYNNAGGETFGLTTTPK